MVKNIIIILIYPQAHITTKKAVDGLLILSFEEDIIERDLTNQVDVLSDTLQIMDDIIGQFRLSVEQSLGNFNELYYLQDPVNCMPFLEKFTDLCGGWSAQLSIDVMTPLNRCDAAFESFITPTPTQTPTQTNTPSQTPTQTNTPSPTSSETPTPTQTETPTNTPTPTSSETPTPTTTNTQTPTPTNTQTPSPTPSAGGNKLWNTNTTNWENETGLWNTV